MSELTRKASRASPYGRRTQGDQAGVTLIELMVVVAVVGILSAIAFPSYRKYVQQTNRTDAVRSLTLNAQMLQRCYSQYFAFNNANCPALPVLSANGNYTLAAPTLTATTYTLTAVPVGVQANDTTCASFSLDQTGAQTALDSGNNPQNLVCWGAN